MFVNNFFVWGQAKCTLTSRCTWNVHSSIDRQQRAGSIWLFIGITEKSWRQPSARLSCCEDDACSFYNQTIATQRPMMLKLSQNANEKKRFCSSRIVCTHTSKHTNTHKGCHSAFCLRVYDWALKQCTFLSKHLIIPAAWQKDNLSFTHTSWEKSSVLPISAGCTKALCTRVCVIYLINISPSIYKPLSIWMQWTFPPVCTWKK